MFLSDLPIQEKLRHAVRESPLSLNEISNQSGLDRRWLGSVRTQRTRFGRQTLENRIMISLEKD